MRTSHLFKFQQKLRYLTRSLTWYRYNSSLAAHTAPKNLITTEEHTQRRDNFVDKIQKDAGLFSDRHVAVFPSAAVHYMAVDVPFVFRQDSNFRYLTGFPETNSVLMLELNSSQAPKWSLFVEERPDSEIVWSGESLGRSKAASMTGIGDVRLISQFPADLTATLTSHTTLWYDSKGVNYNFRSGIVHHSVRELRNPAPLVEQLRLFKSPAELSMLAKAGDIGCASLRDVMQWGRPGVGEGQLWARVEMASRLRGAALAYPPVIAGGVRANTIHYLKNDGVVGDGDMVLMDVGSDVHGYVSDITRTWPINGRFSPAQRVLYEIVLDVLEVCISQCSPDMSLSKLYFLMSEELSTRLVNEGVVDRENSAEVPPLCSISSQLGHMVCPHHIGHYLGLDVHDTPSIRTSHPLLPGIAFPLEPACYFPPNSSLPRPEFRGLGLRIEEDCVMTSEGRVRLLTDSCPRSLQGVEQMVLSGVGGPEKGQKTLEIRGC